MLGPIPTRYFLCAGFGEASTELNAFDAALLSAGVGDTNLVKMSSILPPRATEIQPYELAKGSLVPLAYGEMTCDKPGTLISAAVAVGIPEDDQKAGLIMECSRVGTADVCEETVRRMVREGMETIRGNKIKDIKSISISLTVKRIGSVFAAVVLCP